MVLSSASVLYWRSVLIYFAFHLCRIGEEIPQNRASSQCPDRCNYGGDIGIDVHRGEVGVIISPLTLSRHHPLVSPPVPLA